MTHPRLPFDAGLIDDIAARMDLRAPNREALEGREAHRRRGRFAVVHPRYREEDVRAGHVGRSRDVRPGMLAKVARGGRLCRHTLPVC